MGYLTTHILDTAQGLPASNMKIELYRVEDDRFIQLASALSNSDGRVDGPILPESDFEVGVYELRFYAGDYLRSQPQHGQPLGDVEPLFLDIIPIRFGMSDGKAHYHVPLLLSPFGYSTYRGS